MKTNKNLQVLVNELKKQSIEQDVALWKRVASDIEKTKQNKIVVNLYKIEKAAKDNEIVVVPGKVLSVGEITKPITVAALKFSEQAKEKIQKAKGNVYTIQEIMKQSPKGKNIRLMN